MAESKRLWVFLALLWLLGCSPSAIDTQQRLYIFGTLLELQLNEVTPSQAQQAYTQLDHQLQRMHRDWHGWKEGGELYAINRRIADGEQQIPISDFVAPLISHSKLLYERSGGLFNPAMGRLIGLWGFHQDVRPHGEPPTRAAIAALVRQRAGMDELRLQDGMLLSSNPAVELDFGGFAKGYALDLARAQLQAMGITHAMLNAGGDLCVLGANHQRPWRVGIRHPQGKGVLASLEVADGECVMTSGNYERYLEHQGVRYAHILDPRSGMPVRGIVSVTVIDRDGGLADAAATALTVAGSEQWYPLAKRMGLKYVMLVADDGTVYVNPAMEKRLRYEGEIPGEVVVSEGL